MKDILVQMAKSYCAVSGDGEAGGSIVGHGPRCSFVLTCQHVVGSDKRPTVDVRDDEAGFMHISASVVAVDAATDLALIKTRKRITTDAIPLSDDAAELYESAFVMGNHAESFGVAGPATICAVGGNGKQIQFTGPAAVGMSGGMLCNIDGELIGVLASVHRDNEHLVDTIGYAVPLATVKEFLEKHMKGVG